MEKKIEIRLAGSGGQGIILASIILAQAALLEGEKVAQSQSYGPEARGGMCKAEVVVSEAEIDFAKVQIPDFLLALTQKSFDEYASGVSEKGVIMVDESLTVRDIPNTVQVVRAPILQTAREVVGKSVTSNIVAVGAINAFLGIASEENIRQAVLLSVPKGTFELNAQALAAGATLISEDVQLPAFARSAG